MCDVANIGRQCLRLLHVVQLRLSLLQPVRHVPISRYIVVAVVKCSCASSLSPARWASLPHPERGGGLHRLPDMRPGRLGVKGFTARLGLAEDQETGRLVAALAAIAQSAGGS